MRKPPTSAFTLLEMLTVLAIIVILSGLVLAVGGYVQKRSARARAEGEIASLSSACESYKSDNGNYPRDIGGATDALTPKQNFLATDPKYAAASLFLYKELTGDKTTEKPDGTPVPGTPPNGIPDGGEPRYLKEFEPRILNARKDPSTKKIIEVKFLQDPFAFSYGYSTYAAKDEQDYQKQLLQNPNNKSKIIRPSGAALHGFNPGSFDLWSTGGSVPKSIPGSPAAMDLEWAKWVKNW